MWPTKNFVPRMVRGTWSSHGGPKTLRPNDESEASKETSRTRRRERTHEDAQLDAEASDSMGDIWATAQAAGIPLTKSGEAVAPTATTTTTTVEAAMRAAENAATSGGDGAAAARNALVNAATTSSSSSNVQDTHASRNAPETTTVVTDLVKYTDIVGKKDIMTATDYRFASQVMTRRQSHAMKSDAGSPAGTLSVSNAADVSAVARHNYMAQYAERTAEIQRRLTFMFVEGRVSDMAPVPRVETGPVTNALMLPFFFTAFVSDVSEVTPACLNEQPMASGGTSPADLYRGVLKQQVVSTRAHEESELREPKDYERACSRGQQCVGLRVESINGEPGFILKQYLFMDEAAEYRRELTREGGGPQAADAIHRRTNTCLLCVRGKVHAIVNLSMKLQKSQRVETLTPTPLRNLVDVPGEYRLEDTIGPRERLFSIYAPVVELSLRRFEIVRSPSDGLRYMRQLLPVVGVKTLEQIQREHDYVAPTSAAAAAADTGSSADDEVTTTSTTAAKSRAAAKKATAAAEHERLHKSALNRRRGASMPGF